MRPTLRQKPEKAGYLEHKYAVGKIVELTPSYSRAAAIGKYVIRQTMPAPENNSDSTQTDGANPG